MKDDGSKSPPYMGLSRDPFMGYRTAPFMGHWGDP